MQMAIYAGFPAALNGLFAARDVFIEKKLINSRKLSRPEIGWQAVVSEVLFVYISKQMFTKGNNNAD